MELSRRTLIVVAFAWAQPLVAGPLGAQVLTGGDWSVVSASLEADFREGDGSALVRVRYELAGTPFGAPLPLDEPIAVHLLGFGEATTGDVILESGDRVVLWPTVGSHRAAVVEAPASFAGETLPFEATYRIDRAVVSDGAVLRARVPILSGPAVLTDVRGPGFQARLLLPADWVLSEGFPSGLRRQDDGAYVVTLPVVPSVVAFRARTDGVWRPGFPFLVDLLTLLVLGSFAGFGWRHLRSMAE